MSNNNKTWDFQKQLEIGNRAEELFMERYPRKLEIFPGREYDFTVKSSREKVELKTDTYNMNKSPNFFFERFSDVHRQTPGGPWRAYEDGIDIFCYYFARHNLWYEFRNLPELIKKLNKLTKKQGLIYVKNKRWITGGYKVSRDMLEDYYDIYEFNPEEDQ